MERRMIPVLEQSTNFCSIAAGRRRRRQRHCSGSPTRTSTRSSRRVVCDRRARVQGRLQRHLVRHARARPTRTHTNLSTGSTTACRTRSRSTARRRRASRRSRASSACSRRTAGRINRLTLNARRPLRPVHRRLSRCRPRARACACRRATSRSRRSTGINIKDITPQLGASYDLFGNGKTALKVSLGKYMPIGVSTVGNPAGIVNTDRRGAGPIRTRTSIPDCNLLNLQRATRRPTTLRRCLEPRVRAADVGRAVQRRHALRLGQPGATTGSSRRASQHELTPRVGHRRRLLPALVRQLPGRLDNTVWTRRRLRQVQHHRAARFAAARRRRLRHPRACTT